MIRDLLIRNVKNLAGHYQEASEFTKTLERGTKVFWWSFPLSVGRAGFYTSRQAAQLIGLAGSHIRPTELMKGVASAASELRNPQSDLSVWVRKEGRSVVNQARSVWQELGLSSPIVGKLSRGTSKICDFVINFGDVSSRGPAGVALYESSRKTMADVISGKLTKEDASHRLLLESLMPLERARMGELMSKAMET